MGITSDLRFALRVLSRKPAFTLVVLLTLSLGIGAGGAMFSLVHALLVRPIDLPDLDRMVVIQSSRGGDEFETDLAPGNLLDLRADTRSFEGVAATQWWEAALTGDGDPEQIVGCQVGEGFFDLLGVRPALGRWFAGDEVDGKNENVVVLSHALWDRRYARDPGVIGRTITLAGGSYTVVGVMPRGFRFPRGAELWAPITLTPEQRQDHRSTYLGDVAKLRPGATVESADAEARQLAQRYASTYPELATTRLRAVSLVRGLTEDSTRNFIYVLFGSAIFVLLIACANVANVFLAYSLQRRRELAVRAALGAGRGRIVRQLLTEAILLGLASGGASLLLAGWAVDLVKGALPASIVRFVSGWETMGVEPAVIGFALAIGLLVGVVFGIVPALSLSRADVGSVLKEEGRGATSSAQTHRLRNALVVGQVALALILLISAAALTRGFVHQADAAGRGIDPTNVLTMRVQMPVAREAPPPATILDFERRVLERLGALPGVAAAGAVNIVPWANQGNTRVAYPEGRVVRTEDEIAVDYRTATPGYLELLRIPRLEGRTIASGDDENAPLVAVVSATAARRLWPGESAIGKRFHWSQKPVMTVVGIVGDVHDRSDEPGPRPTVYVPFAQAPSSNLFLAVRTTADPLSVASAARAAVFAVDPRQPVTYVRTMGIVVAERNAGLRIASGLMGAFALLALVLAAVGIYGVVATLVAQRTHEIGVRLALGARERDVLRLVLGKGMLLTIIGVAIGLAGGAALLRFMTSVLPPSFFEAGMLVFAAVPALVAASAIVGSLVPALRASRVDPLIALRHD